MSSFNQCTFMGNLGRDPEVRYTPAGKAVCDFSLAVSHSFAAGGERQENTTWIKVVCWEKTAENAAKYLKKGKPVLVSGRLEIKPYETRDGKKGTSVELVAFSVVFVGSRDDAGGREHRGREPERQQHRSNQDPNDDDIPF